MRCRLCKREIKTDIILKFNSFPKAAQYYPTENEFLQDNGITLRVLKCEHCGLVQLKNKPVSYYKEVITAAGFSDSAKITRKDEFGKIINKYNLNGKKALEVGCAKGYLVGVLNELGLEASGIEYSQDNVDFAVANHQNVIKGYLLDLDKSFEREFDFVISINYIEHQPDTKQFIKKIHSILKDDGICYITAPSLEYILETDTLYEFVADHLVYFTKKMFELAFAYNGFDVMECGIINNKNDVFVIAKKRSFKKIDGIENVNKVILEIRKVVKEYKQEGKKIAVWGAGHRTLALLSLAKLQDIEFIVDSAPFKQGKYAPIIHKKILSPMKLFDSDVEVILVMLPGIYPDEVIKIIQKQKKEYIIYKLFDNKLEKV